jgi:transposase
MSRSAAFNPSIVFDNFRRDSTDPASPLFGYTTVSPGHDRTTRVPVRPVRRPLGPDRAPADRLAPGPHRRPHHAGDQRPHPTHDLREIVNAILYLNRTGIAWRYLPHDFPPHATVYGYFALWSNEGIITELNYHLTGLVRDHRAAPSSLRHPSWTRRA